MTERLYYTDSNTTEFQADVVRRGEVGGRPAVYLARTYFYPESGGQPSDRGRIGGTAVLDVVDEGDEIAHIVASVIAPGPVACVIDRERRFDHMQQHTGQHVLSRALLDAFQAATLSFHLSATYSSIDLDPALDEHQLREGEAAANRIIWENRLVQPYFVDAADAGAQGLRKAPAPGRERVRIVEIQQFDRSACGGTHVRATGEIGALVIRRTERISRGQRLEFLCGGRVVGDYQAKNATDRELTALLSAGNDEVVSAVRRLLEANRDLAKKLDDLVDQALEAEADQLLAASSGRVRIVSARFDRRDVAEGKRLAAKIANRPAAVALIGIDSGAANLIFARSADVELDVVALLREVGGRIGVRGGGSGTLAQGGGGRATELDRALAEARDQVARCLA